MDSMASAAKRPVTEKDLHSLGWTYAEDPQTWNFHGVTIPCLAIKPALIEDVLRLMRTRLKASLDNIDANLRVLGIETGPRPEFVRAPSGVQKRPGLKFPTNGTHDVNKSELYKFIETVVDVARNKGACVQITIDPTKHSDFDPLKYMEQMLGGRCHHCGGQHG